MSALVSLMVPAKRLVWIARARSTRSWMAVRAHSVTQDAPRYVRNMCSVSGRACGACERCGGVVVGGAQKYGTSESRLRYSHSLKPCRAARAAGDFSEPVLQPQRLCSEVTAAMMRSCNCQGGRFTARGTARRRKEAARWMQRHRHRGPTPTC